MVCTYYPPAFSFPCLLQSLKFSIFQSAQSWTFENGNDTQGQDLTEP